MTAKNKKAVQTAVIIPTCMLAHVEKHIATVFKTISRDSVIILSINPKDTDQAEAVMEAVNACKRYMEERYLKNINLVELWHDGPIGFGEACNKGYEYLIENYTGMNSVIFLNDDVRVTENWDQKLTATVHSKYYTTGHVAIRRSGQFFDVNDLGMKVGIAGPLCNFVAGDQACKVPDDVNYESHAKHLEASSVYFEQSNRPGEMTSNAFYTRIHTSFISGMCMACNPEMLEQRYDEKGFIFDPRYLVGGFEDNDLCAWAAINKWACLIDTSTYLHHTGSRTLMSEFADQHNGMKNWSIYFDHWKEYTQRDQKVVGAYRVSFPNINSLAQMGSSIRINIPKLDGLALLLTANPAESLKSYDKPLFDRLQPQDQDFLKGCEEAKSNEEIKELFMEWVQYYSPPDYPVEIEIWDFDLPMNERDERNRVYEMASKMDADWVFSIDSDECFEDRIQRSDLERLMKNPDPLITGYAVGWINHYEKMNLIRHDYPYANGYRSGMNGVRLWRLYHDTHIPIRAGNNIGFHCGNAPELGSHGLRGTTLRFRHLSMVREIDRKAKVHFYNTVDQDKDPQMIGGANYFHIGRSETVQLSLYNPANGIGSFMLAYEDESEVSLCHRMSENYSFSDEQLIIWTGEWNDSDEDWIDKDVSELPSHEEWREKYPTGPGWMVALASKLHDVRWLKRSIKEGLAQCRNAAIEYFETNSIGKIGWCFYLDPDEHPESGIHHTDFACSLRRMAESTDSWGFRFKFANPTTLQNGKSYMSPSEAIRLIKIDRGLKLRFSGLVHETIEERLNELRMQGATPIINVCPISFVNAGLYNDELGMQRKFRKYTQLIKAALEKNPYDASSWSSLGLTYEQDGKEKEAEVCYERACLVAGNAFLPFKLLGSLYARMAMGLFYKAGELSKNAPEHSEMCMDKFKYLYENIGEFPKIKCGDYKSTDEIELPQFPYEQIQYDDKMNQIVIRKEETDEKLDRNFGN